MKTKKTLGNKLTFWAISLPLLFAILFPRVAWGATATPAAPAAGPSVMSILETRLEQLIILAALFMFGFGIITYIGAGGDSKKIGAAKEQITSAVVALIALVLVKMFLKF